jgi:nicotinamidase/pyrazinamidase
MSKEFEKTGVIVVDIQGDFTEAKSGSLAVPGTDKTYIETVAEATEYLKESGFSIFATQDWHPANHVSFFTNHPGKEPFGEIDVDDRIQILWPPHCVQGTENAKILLDEDMFHTIIKKGQNEWFDSYSGFQDDGGQKTELDSILRRTGIEKLVVYGLATDFCVKATALDAKKAGYHVILIKNLCRGVDPETTSTALKEMEDAGVIVVDSLDIEKINNL